MSLSPFPRSRRLLWLALLTVLFCAAFVQAAAARSAYVADFNASAVSVLDTQTDLVTPPSIGVGPGPYAVAFTPDGKLAYVANEVSGDVTVISTQTNLAVGSPIKVGNQPHGIAISPDGSRVYVTDFGDDAVSVINTQTNQVVGSPIAVGAEPIGIAITPDGKTAYVADYGSTTVSVIDTQAGQALVPPITVGEAPFGLAVTPDGNKAFVANDGSASVSVISTASNQTVGSPITIGESPHGVAITPDGKTAYVADYDSKSVSTINTETDQATGEISVGNGPVAIAFTPNGGRAFVADYDTSSVWAIDTASRQLVGTPTAVGENPSAVAVAPDQAPVAAFTAARARPGVPTRFDAAASTDADGPIAAFQWSFGNGQAGSGPQVSSTFAKPGSYQATLTLTDGEGCSTLPVFTGQTVSCNGSAAASKTETIAVAYPGVRLRCPKSTKPRGCRFKLEAVTKKRKGKAETRPAKSKAKPGHAVILALKPKKAFAAKLAVAAKVLVKETVTSRGKTRTSFRKLKIVQ